MTKHILGLAMCMLCCLSVAQHRLDIENSSNGEYDQAWQEATLDEVKAWTQTGSSVNAQNGEGRTPFM
jgi:predicted Zn-dependent protease